MDSGHSQSPQPGTGWLATGGSSRTTAVWQSTDRHLASLMLSMPNVPVKTLAPHTETCKCSYIPVQELWSSRHSMCLVVGSCFRDCPPYRLHIREQEKHISSTCISLIHLFVIQQATCLRDPQCARNDKLTPFSNILKTSLKLWWEKMLDSSQLIQAILPML